MKRLFLVFPLVVGCAGASGSADADSSYNPAKDLPLNLKGAHQLLDALTSQWPAPARPELLQPENLSDVEAVLKLDQVNLFGGGVAFARKLEGVEAAAMEAQIQLAWGESYLTALDIMLTVEESLLDRRLALRALSPRTPDQDTELRWLEETISQMERIAEASQHLSIEHMTLGATRADDVITGHPDNYLGYRVAADYYRMVRDWDGFAITLEKLGKLNPDSNGLVFQRGAAAFQRDGDVGKAAGLLRMALEREPGFVRAQAHLVAIQEDEEGLYREYRNLKELNPQHQIVMWAGETIEWAHRNRGVTQ